MREALALVGEEGLDAMWARHQREHEHLWAGLTEMGLEPFVENPDERLITVNTIKVPLPAAHLDMLCMCQGRLLPYICMCVHLHVVLPGELLLLMRPGECIHALGDI